MAYFESQTERSLSTSYDSRARFVKNTTAGSHGLTRRNMNRYYRNNNEDTNPTIHLNAPNEIKYMQRKRNNSILIDKQLEVKYVDDNTLLMRVTCDEHPMTDAPGASRWSFNNADALHSLTVSNGPTKTHVETYLLTVDSDMTIAIENEEAPTKLLFGVAGESKYNDIGEMSGRVVITDPQKKSVTCIRLQGANVNLWENAEPEKISYVLNPTTQEYVSPTFESLGFEDFFEEAKGEDSPIILKGMALYKINDETTLNSKSGKLTTTLDIKNVIISCSIMKGSILTYVDKEGKTLSKDIPQGVYNILTRGKDVHGLARYREQVLRKASEISVDFAVSRLDYLTVMDVEKGSTNKDTQLEGRVDYGANMDIKKDKENVNTDKLLDRISFVDLGED